MGSVSENKDDYVLKRNVMSRIRLNLSHFMYRKIFGYVLHPAIPRGEDLKIADVATGSGVWMLDLMSDLPASTSYHGFDIDSSQLPPKEWMPSNFSFSKLDLYQELPQELEGAFDVINIRLLILVVKDNDPTSILRKVLRMLKPGGWLQWSEGSHEGVLDFVKAQPQLTGSAMKELRTKFASNHDDRFEESWCLDLPNFFTDNGLEDVQSDQKNSVDFLPWLAFITDIVTAVYPEMITANFPPGSERDELMKLYDRAARESFEGTAWNGPRINVVGRKPKTETVESSVSGEL